ncbi:hypothetical protein AAFC00_004400 [Neodothiora populina]|uniref:Uncharacterized protein n=1 Tax=Neodothiora populina TaxID=2781224 RepID=A0ABR3PPN2_9PEZI
MRPVRTLAAGLSTLALTLASAQLLDIAGIDAAGPPLLVVPALATARQTVSVLPVAAQVSAAAATVSAALATSDLNLPSTPVEKREGSCAKLATGAGPVASPDTPAAFLANNVLWGLALDAATPYGYSQVFSNLTASIITSNYRGLFTMSSYDPAICQKHCDADSSCLAFNIYAERDPAINPNTADCPNPNSTTNYGCTLWGVPVTASQATNVGQWRASFKVLIAASNAYNKDAVPPTIANFTGPTRLPAAIDAVYLNGYITYMGFYYFPFSQNSSYNPALCAAACSQQTAFDMTQPDPAGYFMACNSFVAYITSKNGVPQGLYCANYNYTWGPSFATNYGREANGDRYTITNVYQYYRTNPIAGKVNASSVSSTAVLSSTSSSTTLVSISSTLSSISSSTLSRISSTTSSTILSLALSSSLSAMSSTTLSTAFTSITSTRTNSTFS